MTWTTWAFLGATGAWAVYHLLQYWMVDRPLYTAMDAIEDRQRLIILQTIAALTVVLSRQSQRRKQDWSPREDPELWK